MSASTSSLSPRTPYRPHPHHRHTSFTPPPTPTYISLRRSTSALPPHHHHHHHPQQQQPPTTLPSLSFSTSPLSSSKFASTSQTQPRRHIREPSASAPSSPVLSRKARANTNGGGYPHPHLGFDRYGSPPTRDRASSMYDLANRQPWRPFNLRRSSTSVVFDDSSPLGVVSLTPRLSSTEPASASDRRGSVGVNGRRRGEGEGRRVRGGREVGGAASDGSIGLGSAGDVGVGLGESGKELAFEIEGEEMKVLSHHLYEITVIVNSIRRSSSRKHKHTDTRVKASFFGEKCFSHRVNHFEGNEAAVCKKFCFLYTPRAHRAGCLNISFHLDGLFSHSRYDLHFPITHAMRQKYHFVSRWLSFHDECGVASGDQIKLKFRVKQYGDKPDRGIIGHFVLEAEKYSATLSKHERHHIKYDKGTLKSLLFNFSEAVFPQYNGVTAAHLKRIDQYLQSVESVTRLLFHRVDTEVVVPSKQRTVKGGLGSGGGGSTAGGRSGSSSGSGSSSSGKRPPNVHVNLCAVSHPILFNLFLVYLKQNEIEAYYLGTSHRLLNNRQHLDDSFCHGESFYLWSLICKFFGVEYIGKFLGPIVEELESQFGEDETLGPHVFVDYCQRIYKAIRWSYTHEECHSKEILRVYTISQNVILSLFPETPSTTLFQFIYDGFFHPVFADPESSPIFYYRHNCPKWRPSSILLHTLRDFDVVFRHVGKGTFLKSGDIHHSTKSVNVFLQSILDTPEEKILIPRPSSHSQRIEVPSVCYNNSLVFVYNALVDLKDEILEDDGLKEGAKNRFRGFLTSVNKSQRFGRVKKHEE
eukprot:TRINITY_DN1326_c0_g1_i2.p1 TRINITY_DN1326_c0_g1~~TRINITY_DN1326_c0_g1_i2.p1  ORF type:complete len:810 (-),score=150.02 TRINITY_DN1326_c0_g1_i2:153-2582(-)